MKIDHEEKEMRKFLAFFLEIAIGIKGISQIELSNRVGIKKSALSDIFNGKTTPSLLRTLKIFKELDVKIEDYLNKWEKLK